MKTTKGIILAAGAGSRLYPATLVTNKQLLPVYDKPMIYYALSTLMLAGIRDVMIICSPESYLSFKKLFENGSHIGINIEIKVQDKPMGVAHGLIIAEEFIGADNIVLTLGDNIFYGHYLTPTLKAVINRVEATNNTEIFAYRVRDPERFGVISFEGNLVTDIEEKPKHPKSNYASAGLYVFNNSVKEAVKTITTSSRGEYEITDVLKYYMNKHELNVTLLGRGYAWLDTGTHESLIAASNFIETVEKRQGVKIGCIEEIAFIKEYITKDQLLEQAGKYKNEYGSYLIDVANGAIV